MVRTAMKAFVLLALLAALCIPGGCRASDTPAATDETVRMHGPEIPPDGMAYDEWKQFSYSTDPWFTVQRSWILNTRSPVEELEKRGYTRDPALFDATVTIVRAEAEPLGGEMKLRSGGFVEITVVFNCAAVLQYYYNGEERDIVSSVQYGALKVEPFDRYTGTAFLNFSRYDNAKPLSVGQATDSGFIESRITWKGKTSRILVKEDERNTGGLFSFHREQRDGRTYTSVNASTETIFTFRVPADYDGLAFCIPKSTGVRRSAYNTDDSDLTSPGYTDLYADIMTEPDGDPKDPSGYIFILVSDLLERLNGTGPEE